RREVGKPAVQAGAWQHDGDEFAGIDIALRRRQGAGCNRSVTGRDRRHELRPRFVRDVLQLQTQALEKPVQPQLRGRPFFKCRVIELPGLALARATNSSNVFTFKVALTSRTE